MVGFRPRFFVTPAGSPARSPVPADAAGAAVGPGVSGQDLTGSQVALSADDSHHATHVLRLAPGDACEAVVEAAVYAATVVAAGASVRLRLEDRLEGAASGAAYRFEVGVVQDVDRPGLIDHVIEKGTEVGASFFLLLSGAGSSRSSASAVEGRAARWERIAREAAKQSKHVLVPTVQVYASIEAAAAALEVRGAWSVVLEPGAPQRLDHVLAQTAEAEPAGAVAGPRPIALWVGSEGGWTAAEREAFASAGFTTARLGRSVLRTETAGPVAVAVARLALGDW